MSDKDPVAASCPDSMAADLRALWQRQFYCDGDPEAAGAQFDAWLAAVGGQS